VLFHHSTGDPSVDASFVNSISELRSIENVYILVARFDDVKGPKEDMPRLIASLLDGVSDTVWSRAREVWSVYQEKVLEVDPSRLSKPTFRCTPKNMHSKREDKTAAAAAFAERVAARFGWQAELRDFQMEIVLRRRADSVDICMALSPESVSFAQLKGQRVLGSAALRPSVAFAICRLAQPQLGEVFLDAMCGCGTLTDLAALKFPRLVHLIGDNAEIAVEKTGENLAENRAKITGGHPAVGCLALWDARALPLADASVDVIVANMPFGKRIGPIPQRQC